MATKDGQSIVQAESQDLDQIIAIVHAAYSGYIPRMGKKPAPMSTNYQALLTIGTLFVFKQNDVVCGVMVLQFQGNVMQVDNVAVDPAVQGRGIGYQLLQFAETWARQEKMTAVTLYTNELMHENHAFYKKLGYVEVDRKSENGYRRVYYRKDLV